MRTAIIIFAAILAPAAHADRIYHCTEEGKPVFSDRACEPGQIQHGIHEYRLPLSGWNGSAIIDQNRVMLQEQENRKARTYEARLWANRNRPQPLGHGDRLRIRELEMKKSELHDDLKRLGGHGRGNLGTAGAIASQIRGLDRQIEQIRAHPTGN